MGTTDELKPCPFCGGEAAIGATLKGEFVNCVECLASTNVLLQDATTKAEAVAAWNRRTGADK